MTHLSPHFSAHDSYHLAQNRQQGWSTSFLLSILVHGLALSVIFYLNQTPNIEKNRIQAELVNATDILDIESQIRASVQTNGSAISMPNDNGFNNPNTDQMSAQDFANSSNSEQRIHSNAPMLLQSNDNNRIFAPAPNELEFGQEQKSDAMKEYERRLLEKEAAYLAQQQAFAKQLDDEIAQEMQRQRAEERQRLQEQQKIVDELKRGEKNNDSIIAINKEQTKTAKQTNTTQATQLTQNQSISSNMANLEQTQNTTHNKNSGNALGAIKSKIQSHFSAPVNTDNQRSVLVIKVAQDGTVLDVTVSGSHSALNDAAKAAVYAASPLPIDADNPKTYPIIRIGLTGTS